MIRRTTRRLFAELQLRRDPVQYFRRQGFDIGDGCRLISASYGLLGTEPTLVRIGDDVVVSTGVQFITHDGAAWVLRPEVGPIDIFGRIVIRNGAFIGARAILLPGVTIGSSAVVGAGAVVSRSVPDRVVVVGSPARVVMTVDEYRTRYERYFHLTGDLAMREKHAYLRKTEPETLLVRPELLNPFSD